MDFINISEFGSLFILILAILIASVIASLVGTGGAILLLPFLVHQFGIREAVPIYTLLQLSANLSRIRFYCQSIHHKIVFYFALGAIPAALAGSYLFSIISDRWIFLFLGVFLIISGIAPLFYHIHFKNQRCVYFTPIGALFGVISAIAGSAGPFVAPFYLAFGLSKEFFIATEASGTALMHLAKLSGYAYFGILNSAILFKSALFVPFMILGSYCGSRILNRISTEQFKKVIPFILCAYGVWFLYKAQ